VPNPMVLDLGHVKVIKQGGVDMHSNEIFSKIVHINVKLKHDRQS
jgi:hypothetical protein